MLWKIDACLYMQLNEECRLEQFWGPDGEDALVPYKLYSNGGRLGVLYDAETENEDAKTTSASFRKKSGLDVQTDKVVLNNLVAMLLPERQGLFR